MLHHGEKKKMITNSPSPFSPPKKNNKNIKCYITNLSVKPEAAV